MRVFTLELQNRRVFGFLSGHASSGIVTMIWKITLAYGGGPIVSMRQGSSRSSMVVLSGGGHQWSLHPLSGRTEVSSPFSLPPRKAGCLMPPDLSGIGRFRTIFMLRQQSIQRLSEMQIEQNGRKKLHRIAGGSRGSKRGNKIKMTVYRWPFMTIHAHSWP
jgi:hypothetical protein